MTEQDTVKLLRECDAGVKMAVSSIDEVLPYVKSEEMFNYLKNSKEEHSSIGDGIMRSLSKSGDDGKDPSPIAKGMSAIKTEVKLIMKESDATIADLMTDGCNMGVKSLNRYLNQYKAASEDSKNTAKKLIRLEEQLAQEMQMFL